MKIPDETCLTPTIERMRVRETHNLINLLNKSFGVSKIDNRAKEKQLWINESQRILQASIGSFSLCDLHNIKGVIAKESKPILKKFVVMINYLHLLKWKIVLIIMEGFWE